MAEFKATKDEFAEFAEFVAAPPRTPRRETDAAVMRRAQTGVRPSFGTALAKLFAIQVSAGLLTLAVCPQFGIGASDHTGVLHALHAFAQQPALYHFTCGLIFVLFGALLSGLAANRRDLLALGRGKYVYFAVYGSCAYLILITLGSEAFILSSLAWLVGALLGHLGGFALGTRLKAATTVL